MPKNPFTKALNHARKRRVAPTVTRQLDPDGLTLDGATALLEAAETGLHASTGTVTDPSMTSGMLTHVFRLLSLESLLSAGTGQGTRNGMLGMGIVTDLQVPADTAGQWHSDRPGALAILFCGRQRSDFTT